MNKKVLILIPLLLIVVIFGISYYNYILRNSERFTGVKKRMVVAIVPKSLDNPFFFDVKKGAQAAGKELDIAIKWAGPSSTDTNTQIAIIEGLIQEKVDGILISANSPTALNYVINKAVRSGIKVATFDSDSPDSNRYFYIGTHNYAAGYKCGEIMKKLIKDSGLTKKTIHVTALSGTKGSNNLDERIKGLTDAIAESNIVIDEILYCDDDANTAISRIGNAMLKNGNLDAWVMLGGWPFYNPEITLSPLYELKKRGGFVIGIDTVLPVLKFVKSGVVDVLVGQNAYEMGKKGVTQLSRLINGEDLENKIIYTGLEIVDHINIDEVINEKSKDN